MVDRRSETLEPTLRIASYPIDFATSTARFAIAYVPAGYGEDGDHDRDDDEIGQSSAVAVGLVGHCV